MKVHVVALLVGSLFVTGWTFPGADVSATQAEETRVEHYVWEGYLHCALHDPFGGGTACGLNNQTSHSFRVRPGLQTITATIDWTPSGGNLAEELSMTLLKRVGEIVGTPVANGYDVYSYVDTSGGPGHGFRLDADLHAGDHGFQHMDEDWDLELSVWASGETNVVRDQPFTVHYTLHYGEHAAPWPPAPFHQIADLNGTLPADMNPYSYQPCRLFEESIHRFAVTPGLKTVIATVDWRAPHHNMSLKLGTAVHGPYNHAGISGHFAFETLRGPGPLTLRVDAGPDEPGSALDIDRERLFFLQLCNGTPNNIILDMPFAGRYAVFYHEHAPDGFTLEADA